MRRWLIPSLIFGIPLVALLSLGPRPSPAVPPPGEPDPATMPLELRPGGFFPEGFPLEGRVRLLTPPIAEAGARTRIKVEYTVGSQPIEPGMSVEIWKHFTSDVEEFQVTDPAAPAFFGYQIERRGIEAQPHPHPHTNWTQRNTPSIFPYRKAAGLTITSGRLVEGDRILFDLGGEQGVRMQHYAENLFNFRFTILAPDQSVMAYAGDAILRVTGGPLARLRVIAPPVVSVGEQFPVEVVPVDEWESPARDGAGVRLVSPSGLSAFAYEPALQHFRADAVASAEGVLRIAIKTEDGRAEGVSNPVRVVRTPVHRVYFGELHQHTYLHDGRGVFEELYRYARQVGLLDFGAVTPHHMPMSVSGPAFHLKKKLVARDNWPDLQKATKLFNGWQDFVSLLGYEYSVGTAAGGHHNVFYNADSAPTTMQLNPGSPMAPIAEMIRTLRLVKVPTLVIPHIGGGPPDWSHPTDPRIERLFEIASVHGVFEESWQKHLQTGVRLGASAAGDTHTVSMGAAYPGLIYTMTNALTGVYSSGRSREQIWEGLYSKRTFATTGNQRMLLEFEVNGEAMGGELPNGHAQMAQIRAGVSGTAPLVRVEIVKNGQSLHSVYPARRPQGRYLRIVWGDNLYQRRAATGLREGSISWQGDDTKLVEVLHRDQAFEEFTPEPGRVSWKSAAVSGDRDGLLLELGGQRTGVLRFQYNDPEGPGSVDFEIPLDRLHRDGFLHHTLTFKTAEGNVEYMERMGLKPSFTIEADLVERNGPLDLDFTFQDRIAPKPGDYYYLRVEQIDTNKAWSSPVWVN